MKLDAARSRLAVYTFAEGFLSALAHDLELVAGDVSGTLDGEKVELRVPVAGLKVTGVMKKGRLDTGVLSAGDRDTIERQIRDEVLAGGAVVARGERSGNDASVEVEAPPPRTARARLTCRVQVTDEAGAKRAKGSAEVSLKGLGAPPVKGPMGAFRVSDKVRVDFDLVFS
jgi:hypothetical protein